MALLKRIAVFSCLIAAACNQSSGATLARGDEARRPAVASASMLRVHPLHDGVLRVWPIGDSITEGVEGGYRNRLYELLRAKDIDVDYVGTLQDASTRIADKDHEGHPGYTIRNAQENLDLWFKNVAPPDVVLVMLGTNDLAWWTNSTVSEHHGYFVKLVDTLLGRLPESLIVVSTIPPQSPEMIEVVKRDRQKMTEEFNAMVRKSVPAHAGYGKRLFLADTARDLSLADLSDGIHPTRKGHEKIAKVWFATLEKALATEKATPAR